MEKAFTYLYDKDKVLKNIIDIYNIPTIPSRPKGFVTLCQLILEQQVSLASAKACFEKLQSFLIEITPESILNASEEQLKSCSVSRQKTIYLKSLSNAILEGLNVDLLSNKSPEEIRTELIKIKGIGNWTVDVYLMFAIQSQDVFPIGDIAIFNTIKELYFLNNKEEMLLLSENWKPYRTYASHLLWHRYLEKRTRKISF